MGVDSILMNYFFEKYGKTLEDLYDKDLEKFKELYKDLGSSMDASLKISGNRPTPEIINRKFVLDCMAALNAKKQIEKYFETSQDKVVVYLREETTNQA